jgi:glycine/D-amino acid oxidase-like deaminating enzyme
MRGWAGLYEMTPDQTGIVSAVHGRIAGQLMAELITDGQARTIDIAPLSLDRFARGETAVEPLTFV